MENCETLRYDFRVNLKRERGVWRTLSLWGDYTLHDLHECIFKAFDRYDDDHLYSFYFPRARPRRDVDSPSPKEYTSPVAFEEPDSYREEGVLDASETELRSLNLCPGDTFEYLFDFGASWWHQGKVISVEHTDRATEADFPIVVERHGESPKQYPEHED